MRKITFLFSFLLLSFLSEAQVIASQNFDTALGWTSTSTTSDAGTTIAAWARRTTGGAPTCAPYAGAGMARFNSYAIPAGGTGRLTSPAMTFTGATYRVKFKMFRDSGYPTDADNVKVYYNTTGAAGGTLLGTVNRSRTLAPIVSADGWYSYAFDIPGNLTGTGYIHLLGTSVYGNNIFVDEVSIEQIQSNDAEMNLFTMNSIILNGSTAVAGTIKNLGLTTINSIDVNWQVDSGTIYTQSLTGLNIAAGQTYDFTHSNQWAATPGLYSVRTWVSNINNGATDGDATNNQIMKSISVASNTTARFPLYEKFSSSTCNPCYGFNTNYFNPFYTTGTNHDNLALICYQVNWPGAGDPYYTAEIGTRVGYYGVNGAPTLYVDSKDGTNFSTAQLQTDLNNALAAPAYFMLNATRALVGDEMTVVVNTTPYLTGSYKLHVAVVEKITTGNIATNGETSFKNVMMKMLPDAQGTTINFTHDVATSTTLQATLTGLNIEEMDDLDVVVFIQNQTTKAIMQAKYATNALSTSEFDTASFKVWPNPSTGIVRIATETPVNVVITDISGKVVFTMNEVSNDSQMNLSSLQKGIYLAKITTNEGVQQTQKIILK
ncbi:MAG: T9SS type A sorting domain-containing protein [Bacteroidota bacterium]